MEKLAFRGIQIKIKGRSGKIKQKGELLVKIQAFVPLQRQKVRKHKELEVDYRP